MGLGQCLRQAKGRVALLLLGGGISNIITRKTYPVTGETTFAEKQLSESYKKRSKAKMLLPQDMILVMELSIIHDIFLTSIINFIQEIPSYCQVQLPNTAQITQRYEYILFCLQKLILLHLIRIYLYFQKLQVRLRNSGNTTMSLYSEFRRIEDNNLFAVDCLKQEFLLKQ